MSVEIWEVIVLLMMLIGYIPLIRAYTRVNRTTWLFAGYTALIIGRIATVAEGFVMPTIFNAIEHGIGILLAGGLFVLYTYQHTKEPSQTDVPDELLSVATVTVLGSEVAPPMASIPFLDLAGAVAFFTASALAAQNYRTSGILSNYWLTFTFTTALWGLWSITEFLDGVGVYATIIDQHIQPSLLAAATGIFVVVAFYDVTQHREYQQQLELSEQRYRQLAQHFPDGVVLLYDDDHRHLMATGDELAVVDPPYAEVEGERPAAVFPEDLATKLGPYYDHALSGETSVFETAIGDNEYRIHVLPITDQTGTVVYGMVVIQDITKLKRRE